MKIIINNIMEHYKDGSPIENKGSHYAYTLDESLDQIIINLSQAQQHAEFCKCSVEHIIIQHIAHETIHRLLRHNISIQTSIDFDNIACYKAFDREGNIAFNKWFGGFYCGVHQ